MERKNSIKSSYKRYYLYFPLGMRFAPSDPIIMNMMNVVV